jgi:hypothetical protein
MDRKHPPAFRFARFLVRTAVILTIVLIGWDVLRRVVNPSRKTAPASPNQEIVELKGRIAELELEIERLRAENEKLKAATVQ